MRRRSLLSLALLLSGCASMAPPYERPAAPVAASFPDAAPAAEAATPPARHRLAQFFTDRG